MTGWTRGLPSAWALAAATALSGCGAAIVPPASTGFTSATRPPQGPSELQAQPAIPVMGLDAKALVRLFGEPRLDIRDPAARKLQFSDGRCVLDAYLYPPRARREPVVTYAEARGADGSAMDWTACALQLRAR